MAADMTKKPSLYVEENSYVTGKQEEAKKTRIYASIREFLVKA